MNVSFRQLRAFVAVARMGSFTSAAESLFLTQSALSGLIKELEQVWGVKLFERTTRRLVLTEVGHALYPKAQALLQQVEQLNLDAGKYRAMHQGRVRVACSQQLAASLLPELIAEYQLQCPNVRIDIIDSSVEKIISHVDANEADLGIGPEREMRSNIQSEILFSLPFHAVLKKNHPLATKKNLTWNELQQEQLITLKGPFSDRLAEQLANTTKPALDNKYFLENTYQVNYMSTALSLVDSGLGITICIPYAKRQIEQYDLAMCKMTKPVVIRHFYLFQRKSTVLSATAQNFKDFVMEKLSKHNYFA